MQVLQYVKYQFRFEKIIVKIDIEWQAMIDHHQKIWD